MGHMNSTKAVRQGLTSFSTSAATVAIRHPGRVPPDLDLGLEAPQAPFVGILVDFSAAVVAGDPANVAETGGPSYIQNMPVELFQSIIRKVVRELPPPPGLDYFRSLADLRLVCKGWTRVVEGMPELWSDLSPLIEEKLLDLALARSLDSPLMIRGFLQPGPIGKIEKLVQHAHRWKTLSVSGNDGDAIDRMLAHPVPLLEELTFSAFISEPPSSLFSNIAPKLQSAHIVKCGLQWSSPAFFDLRDLTLESIDTGAPDVDAFIDILFASPRLIRLKVYHTRLRPSSLPHRLVPLHNLQFVDLEGRSQDVNQIVGSIDMPMSAYSSISFSFGILEDFTAESTIHDHLKPIAQRLQILAEVSQGARSTMTVHGGSRWRITVEYVARDGGLIYTVYAHYRPKILLSVFAYFSRHLDHARTSPPPLLCISHTHHLTVDLTTLLEELNRHLPDTREIFIYNPIHRHIVGVLDRLFALSSSDRLFPQLSVLKIRHPAHDGWAAWLEEKRPRGHEQEANWTLPLKTLKIRGGKISAERLQGLRMLVPEVVLDQVEIQ